MVQDAYVHLLARVRAGNPPEYARGWLYAVVRTRCAEERARRARITVVDPNDVPDVSPGPEDAVIGAAEGRWMLQRVLALPDSERVAVLAHLSGTPGAVTSARGRSPNAKYQALFRGRARLRKAREGLWGVLVLPVWLRTSTLRRTLGSPITRSAFSGGAGVARIAVLVGTTLVTSLGVGPLIHVAEQMASVPSQVATEGRPVALGARSAHRYEVRRGGLTVRPITDLHTFESLATLAGIRAIQANGSVGPLLSGASNGSPSAGPTQTDTTGTTTPTSGGPTRTDATGTTTPTSGGPTRTDTTGTTTPTSGGPTRTDATGTTTPNKGGDQTRTDTTGTTTSNKGGDRTRTGTTGTTTPNKGGDRTRTGTTGTTTPNKGGDRTRTDTTGTTTSNKGGDRTRTDTTRTKVPWLAALT